MPALQLSTSSTLHPNRQDCRLSCQKSASAGQDQEQPLAGRSLAHSECHSLQKVPFHGAFSETPDAQES
jgi:hypothetical protein